MMKPTQVDLAAPCPSSGVVPLESILFTEELHRRPSRPADHRAENEALSALVGALASGPRTVLQTLAETVLKVLGADSAGLSLVTKDGERFFWAAIAGQWQPHIGGGTPREFGPCGDVLDCGAPLLFRRWERRYAYLSAATPLAEEGLLVPFYVAGKAVGTIWAINHDDQRHFDGEDLRLLESLGRFASVAYVAVESLEASDVHLAALGRLEESIQSQRAMETLNAQLGVSKERYRALFDVVPVAVYSCGLSGVIQDFNHRAAELWGRAPAAGDTDERFCGSYKLFRPDGTFMPHHECPMAEVLNGQLADVCDAEVTIERPDGSRVTVVVNIRPLRDQGGVINGAINCFYDITDRKLTEEELAQAYKKERDARNDAEEANRTKDEFLATLSHELRTPLTAILSWSQLIQRPKFDMGQLMRGIKTIEKSAKAQGQLIDDLLDVTRIRSGKLAMNFTEVDPRDSVGLSIEAVVLLAESKKITVESEMTTRSEKVWVDRDRLQQIVRNLLINGINFSPECGVVRVLVESHEELGDRYVSIKVIDSGKGIEPEFLPKLFERFSQADSSSVRIHGGLGLGLTIVRDLVTLQSGQVRAESEGLGKGATFTVLLPIMAEGRRAKDETTPSAVLGIQAEAEPADLSGLRVMIVEDDRKTLEILCETLGHFGAQTLGCGTAGEALAAFEKFKPDVLVSDVSMPIEDGYSLIQKIRGFGHGRSGDVPSLALTAYATPADARRALAAGFDVHMAKPFDVVRLGHAVSSLAMSKKSNQ